MRGWGSWGEERMSDAERLGWEEVRTLVSERRGSYRERGLTLCWQ